MTETKRILAFDLLKGVGILLVILGHIEIPHSLKTVIYSFHMPLFFFVSGCFFKSVSIKTFLCKKWNQLLVPWLFFATVLFIFLFVLSFYETHIFLTALWQPINSVWDGLCGNENSFVLYRTIWFLICLFEVSLLYFVIDKIISLLCCCKYLLVSILSILFYVLGYLMNVYGIDMPYFLDTTLSVFVYFHLGYLFMQKQFYTKIMPVCFSLGILLCAIFFSIYFSVYVELKMNIFPLLLLPLSMIFVVSIYWLLAFFSRRKSQCGAVSKVVLWLGMNSLALMGLHHPMIELFGIIRHKLLLSNYVWSAFEFVIVVMLSCLTAWFVKKKFPVLLGVHNR